VRDFIPVSEPDLGIDERNLLNSAFDSGWISSHGKYVNEFQTSWAEECGGKYSLAVSNGTVALHLILVALGIGPGDEVIVPSLTFIASVNCISYVGANPVFADVNRDTWCIDVETIKDLITPKTKAVMGVHLYGNASGATAVRDLCNEYGILFIEDAAEAPFGSANGEKVGSIGHVSSLSFFGNKIITSGEGGAVVTSNEELFLKMKLLRDQGMDPDRRYFFTEIGYNFRLTNLQCAILCAQLARSKALLEARRSIYHKYDSILNESNQIVQQVISENVISSPWLYTFRLSEDSNSSINELAAHLKQNGIETRPIFIPIHHLPPYKVYENLDLPNSDLISRLGLSLPTSSKMSLDEVEYVAEKAYNYLESK
jgi:perosamine synthetase